ncbi:hypothetical protein WCLP8_1850001 [uncultured Gammaproteobacteria bacterium]
MRPGSSGIAEDRAEAKPGANIGPLGHGEAESPMELILTDYGHGQPQAMEASVVILSGPVVKDVADTVRDKEGELSVVSAKGIARGDLNAKLRDLGELLKGKDERWTGLLAETGWDRPAVLQVAKVSQDNERYRRFWRKTRRFSDDDLAVLCGAPPLGSDLEAIPSLITPDGDRTTGVVSSAVMPVSEPPPLAVVPLAVVDAGDVDVGDDASVFVKAGLSSVPTIETGSVPENVKPVVGDDPSVVAPVPGGGVPPIHVAAPVAAQIPISPPLRMPTVSPVMVQSSVAFDLWAVGEGAWQPHPWTDAPVEPPVVRVMEVTAELVAAPVPETTRAKESVGTTPPPPSVSPAAAVPLGPAPTAGKPLNPQAVTLGTKQIRTFIFEGGPLSSPYPIAITLIVESIDTANATKIPVEKPPIKSVTMAMPQDVGVDSVAASVAQTKSGGEVKQETKPNPTVDFEAVLPMPPSSGSGINVGAARGAGVAGGKIGVATSEAGFVSMVFASVEKMIGGMRSPRSQARTRSACQAILVPSKIN